MSERSISPYERYGNVTPLEDAALKIHVWTITDTISLLAHQYYDDWRLWRIIAEKNNIADVRQIQPGTELIISRLPLEKGKYTDL